ncbi:putative nuclease HARBI1, partial [Orchesella cincta]
MDDEECMLLLTLLESQRYMMPRTVVPKSLHWWETAIPLFDDDMFRTQFRMSRDSCNHLLELISVISQTSVNQAKLRYCYTPTCIIIGHSTFNETQDPIKLQLAIICDIDRKIRDLFTGYPGSVHDAKAFSKSPIAIVPNKFFSAGNLLLEIQPMLFQRTGVQGITPERKAFNRHLSSHRVLVENTIGLLKSRFQSLKSLRIRVSKKSGHAKVCNWIHACAVLHNFLIQQDPWYEPINCDPDTDFDEECQSNEVKSRRGNLKREALFHIFKTLQRNN